MTNETRARLIGWTEWQGVLGGTFWRSPSGTLLGMCRSLPSFDTDANAVAELRKFVWARGKGAEFVAWIERGLGWTGSGYEWSNDDVFDILDATPAQQCAAFDTVFKDELEKL